MSKKLLNKLSTIIATADQNKALDPSGEARLDLVLEEHLDIIAAAHVSTHGSHHNSQIN